MYPEVRCEICGAVLDVEEWIDVTSFGSAPRSSYLPGRTTCPTPGCGTSCPICRRDVGDIHMAECAPIMLLKVTDSAYVTREDCLIKRVDR